MYKRLYIGVPAESNERLVILDSFHYASVLERRVGGEDIWARSTVQALKNTGYTYLYTDATTMRYSVQLYQMLPDLVKTVLVERQYSKLCFEDVTCVMSPQNPSGIPTWKLLSVSFWVQAENPLGHKWTLSPEDPECLSRPFVPHDQRAKPPRAYVLAKKLEYFSPEKNAWKNNFYDDVAAETGAQFLAGAWQTTPDSESPKLPKSVKNFYQALAESPTPYDALCFGVPYINPILQWDKKDPTNRQKWTTQQGLLKHLDPPYVYNLLKGDKEGFLKAIKDALAHPIESYILDRMRMGVVEERLGNILETDWKAEAQILLKERMESGKGRLFTV
ncbi:hypothetical protein B0H17DRAFT_1170194 [Mycena rosella]|uniref:Uncharacterized protein n=1 Tax=Mycena rosella TaxID=1033263 RepID=A0AAD7D6L3_MYCRO|nr:hypothetical protein B0H17DRAFT_1170194 [Mycena rosella]